MSCALDVLALEPYYGGSHQSFLDGWRCHSDHQWTLLTLPAYKWKWRMRHSAITLAAEAQERWRQGQRWQRIVASDMLNVAEFLGLAPIGLRQVPLVLYFHENQLTYPTRKDDVRDYHFAFTNLISASAADEVWFNSRFHQQDFLAAAREFLKRMPDYAPVEMLDRIAGISRVEPPGITVMERRPNQSADSNAPLRIVWNARWEHDKNPLDFFTALESAALAGMEFRLTLLGQRFRDLPESFAKYRHQFAQQIDHWGFVEDASDYLRHLQSADVVVATARHEFFGIAIVEAILAGAYPVLPNRLAYPELFDSLPSAHRDDYLYAGTAHALCERLLELERRHREGRLWKRGSDELVQLKQNLCWSQRATELDSALSAVSAPPEP